MHKIPFFGDVCPIKKVKEVGQLRVGEEEDVGAREDLLDVFQTLCSRQLSKAIKHRSELKARFKKR